MTSKDALYRSVRNVYDQYRSACLGKKYYGFRLSATRYWNIIFEIIIAIGVSSSIGAWALWQVATGKIFWEIFSGLVAVLAIIKPFLQFSKQIERYSTLFIGYSSVIWDLIKVVNDIQAQENYTEELDAKFEAAIERLKQLDGDEDPRPNRRLMARFTKEVNAEEPIERFWWPKREEN